MVPKYIGENYDFVMGIGDTVTGEKPAETSTTNLNSI
jgi:hypothetical protein